MRKLSAEAVSSAGPLLGTALAILIASIPAWTGSWIYDDWQMSVSDKMDGWDDALAAFSRSSADYLGSNAASQVGAVTYRPLSMLSLIVVQAAAPGSALAHHLLSLALHLAATGLLFWTVRIQAGGMAAALCAVLFGLHPLGIEAYGWINGRSDVLAAFGVLLVAFSFFAVDAHRSRAWLLTLVGTALAALAKETALVALAGLLVAALVPVQRGVTEPETARIDRARVLACLAGIAFALLARALALGDIKRTGLSLAALPDLPRGLVRLVAVMLELVVLPLPRTMANLGFRLAEPLAALHVALLIVLLVVLSLLLLRGYLRALLLVLTALAMVLPCVVVRHTFWLGADRYLYIPLALSCLALAFIRPFTRQAVTSSRTRWLGLGALALLLASSSFATAETYHSQPDHTLGMMRMRPDDPSGYLIGARWLWHREQRQGALMLLEHVPRTGLPPAIESQLATVLAEVGKRDEALAVVADLDARYPDDPFAVLNVVSVRLDEGRVREAGHKAETLRTHGGFCQAVRTSIASHLEQERFAAQYGDEARALLASYRCP